MHDYVRVIIFWIIIIIIIIIITNSRLSCGVYKLTYLPTYLFSIMTRMFVRAAGACEIVAAFIIFYFKCCQFVLFYCTWNCCFREIVLCIVLVFGECVCVRLQWSLSHCLLHLNMGSWSKTTLLSIRFAVTSSLSKYHTTISLERSVHSKSCCRQFNFDLWRSSLTH